MSEPVRSPFESSTPGPWSSDEHGWIEGVTTYSGCGTHACQWTNPKDKALALSAPEMLAALEHIIQETRADDELRNSSMAQCIRGTAKGAINKATGRK